MRFDNQLQTIEASNINWLILGVVRRYLSQFDSLKLEKQRKKRHIANVEFYESWKKNRGPIIYFISFYFKPSNLAATMRACILLCIVTLNIRAKCGNIVSNCRLQFLERFSVHFKQLKP